tara:strand:+ start:308 stop:544 length:237 start_codon:yes stop_codon:yes gene_type:complete
MNTKELNQEAEIKNGSDIPEEVDYKDLGFLKTFLSETGKIKPRRNGVLTGKDQRKINKAIKIARYLALLPYCDNHKNQ